MAALLTASKRDKDRTALYLHECRTMGIRVLVPDVNRSESDFAAVDGDITFGMSAVRNVGEAVVEQIVVEREKNGPLRRFSRTSSTRVDLSVLNKRTIESLIKAGAFDSMGHARRGSAGALARSARCHGVPSRGPRTWGSTACSVVPNLGGRGGAGRHPRIDVGQEDPARLREGDARPVCLRSSACSVSRRRCAGVHDDHSRSVGPAGQEPSHHRRHHR